MSTLILWHDKNGKAERACHLLRPAFKATVEAIQAKKPVSWVDRMLQRDVEIKPIAADAGGHRLAILCCAAPRGRLPLEIRSFLFQYRLRIRALACVLITDGLAADTAPVIEDIERHASQRPVAVLELSLRELAAHENHAQRWWVAERKVGIFLDQLKHYNN